MMMKRDYLLVALMCLVVGIAVCMFNGCGDPTAKNETEVKTEAKGGDATIEGADVKTDVAVTGVKTVIEAPYTVSEMVIDILSDWFWRITLIIIGLLVWWDWRNGNLHPAKPKHKKET
jgi:hypothetical protein